MMGLLYCPQVQSLPGVCHFNSVTFEFPAMIRDLDTGGHRILVGYTPWAKKICLLRIYTCIISFFLFKNLLDLFFDSFIIYIYI